MSEESNIARLLDHALLHPTLTDAELRAGFELARDLNVATVCVKPYAIPVAVEILAGTEVGVGTVIGFPHGSSPSEIKAAEAEWACQAGAGELDMVINVGKVLSGDWDYVQSDIDAVVQVARRHQAIVKVIFETDFVTSDGDKKRLCQICEDLGVNYVKTSTGFGFVKQPEGNYNYQGATQADIRLMRETCGSQVGVKASGGIRNYQDAVTMRDLGATRLGTSASEAIVTGQPTQQEGY